MDIFGSPVDGGGASYDQALDSTSSVEFKDIRTNFLELEHQTTPSNPNIGNNRIYTKSDQNLYILDSAGNEIGFVSGGGAIASATTYSNVTSGLTAINVQDALDEVDATQDTHIGDATIHFTEASIDHNNIQNKGTNTHAQIDAHIADATKHRVINDSGTSSTDLWSSQKIQNQIDSQVGGVTYNQPEGLNVESNVKFASVEIDEAGSKESLILKDNDANGVTAINKSIIFRDQNNALGCEIEMSLGSMEINNNGGGTMLLSSGIPELKLDLDKITTNVNFIPTTTNVFDLGLATNRWKDVHAISALIGFNTINDVTTTINSVATNINGTTCNLQPTTLNIKPTDSQTNVTGDLDISGEVKINGATRTNAPIDIVTDSNYYLGKWRGEYVPNNTINPNSSLSKDQTKISFNIVGYQKFIGFPLFDVNSTASFKWIATINPAVTTQYFGITDNPVIDNGLNGFCGQDIGGSYYNNGILVGGTTNQWATGDECEIRIIAGTWQIYKNGIPQYNSYPLTDNGKPYFFCVINNQGGGNLCEYEITAATTDYVSSDLKQIGLRDNGSISYGTLGDLYVQNEALVYKDRESNLVYPIAGKDVKVVKKFVPASTTILYEDDYVRISWISTDLQPSFVLKTLPSGPGIFGAWVDSSIRFVAGNALSGGNGDGTNQLNTKVFFYGETTINTSYNHINYGSTSDCMLIATSDINYPTYSVKVTTGTVGNLGVSVVERY